MRLGIMQPYFFPYLGYFQLMASVDRWVVFDTPQYIRRGWVNRNRVLTLGKDEWKYIQVPVAKACRDTPINQVQISGNTDWRTGIVRMLDYYKTRKAPHYDETIAFLGRAFECQSDNLSEVLVHCLVSTMRHLGIEVDKFEVFSNMDLEIEAVDDPGRWALNISKALDADTYINPSGGREIFDTNEFETAGINLRFLEPGLECYKQNNAEFVAGLSILDVLMWNDAKTVSNMLTEYKIVE